MNWISCSERPPNNGDRVLLSCGGVVTEGYLDGDNAWHSFYIDDVEKTLLAPVTHWMELPEGMPHGDD
jgi:hypothetical protein